MGGYNSPLNVCQLTSLIGSAKTYFGKAHSVAKLLQQKCLDKIVMLGLAS